MRRVRIVLFALGTIGGYGSAVAGAHCRARERQQAFEQHVASVCARAARSAAPAAPPSED